MNEQVRYAIIGGFVLLMLMASIWFVLWMGDSFNHGSKKYWVYFDESVVGLLPKAPVTFNGVTVGDVGEMDVSPNNAKKVRVLLNINAGTPINQSTVAQLDTMGLTGIAFVELKATAATAPPLKPLPGDEYPTIPAKMSFLGSLSNHATTLSANLVDVTENINKLLNKKNLQSISDALHNIAQLSKKMPTSINHLNKTLITLDQAGDSVQQMSHSIRKTSASSRQLLMQVNQQTLPEASQLMKQLSQTATTLQNVLHTLKQHPSMLVRGKAPAALGPGETS